LDLTTLEIISQFPAAAAVEAACQGHLAFFAAAVEHYACDGTTKQDCAIARLCHRSTYVCESTTKQDKEMCKEHVFLLVLIVSRRSSGVSSAKIHWITAAAVAPQRCRESEWFSPAK
jgi:hypothetical protein